jgi:arylsulfatase A-like enzyme
MGRPQQHSILTLSLSISALILLACPDVDRSSAPAGGSDRPNLLVISIDTLRPDMLGAYGYDRPTSPTLDRMAARGVLFEIAVTPTPWTLPAHASLLTGLYPTHHGLKTHDLRMRWGVTTLAERLQRTGYDTVSIFNTHHLDTRWGLDRGFDHTHYARESVDRVAQADVYLEALERLAKPDEPFFLLLHTYDVHSDYRSLPRYEQMFRSGTEGGADGTTAQLTRHRRGETRLGADDRDRLVDLYVAGIRQMDDALAPLFEMIERTGLLDRTVVVITSDHGEELLEHGTVLHGRTQFEEALRIPLILLGPGVPAGVRVSEPVSLIDVVPTALSLLGLPSPPDLDGVDLAPLWREPVGDGLPDRILFGESDHHNEQPFITRSARYRGFKLTHDLRSGRTALYDLANDPQEQRDVSAEHPELVAMLRTKLESFEAQDDDADQRTLPALEPGEADRLRSLGYLQ